VVTASWPLNEALREEGWPQADPLRASISRDVCIVGGGYTGLWTAILLKQAQPELQIALIEQELCGYGASGCNGGCVLTLATKFLSLKSCTALLRLSGWCGNRKMRSVRSMLSANSIK